eukprot:TRINITY_DN3230_c1_g1_i1.p1 TRINITY_DN3230_c1_g1~~TRINITY_DN3230_c1_g1_i1.p1  ORF type:complete len:369 (+),score=15.89 TRINITY_DN3230_c1_g1_i1:51-1109(+)
MTDTAILERVKREIAKTKGIGPCNFTPFREVLDAVGCVKVTMKERGAPELFEGAVVVGPYGEGTVTCGLVEGEEGSLCFVPWPPGTLLKGECVEVPTAADKGQANQWWYRVRPIGVSSQVHYHDNRMEQLKKRPLKTLNYLVFLRLGVTRTVPELHAYLVGSLPRESYHEDEQDEGFAVSKISISIQCPIMGTPIEWPVRPRKCGHPQVWDLKTHLLLLSEQKHPAKGIRCQICDTPYQLRELVIDQTFLNLLQDHSALKRNTVFTLQQWEAYKIPKTPPKIVHRTASGTGYYLLTKFEPPFKGSLLKPLLGKTTTFVQTSSIIDLPPDTIEAEGDWVGYPGLPNEYFVPKS